MYSKFGHHAHPPGYLWPNFISSAASIAELAHGEKSCTQSLTHSSSLFHAKETEALALRNMCKITNMESKTTEQTGIQQEALQ